MVDFTANVCTSVRRKDIAFSGIARTQNCTNFGFEKQVSPSHCEIDSARKQAPDSGIVAGWA